MSGATAGRGRQLGVTAARAAILAVVTVWTLFPIYYMLTLSFTPWSELFRPVYFVQHPTLENYRFVVFPRLRRAADGLAAAYPCRLFFVVPSYKEDYAVSSQCFGSLVAECARLPSRRPTWPWGCVSPTVPACRAIPRRRVRPGKRVVPRDVVLEDRGSGRVQRLLHAGQLAEPLDVVENGFGLDLEDGNFALCHELSARRRLIAPPDPMLRIIGIKTYLDGGMLTGSAYMRQPWGLSRIYAITDPNYRGVLFIPHDRLVPIV